MQTVLAIDTATPNASVALRVGQKVWQAPLGQSAHQSAQILPTLDLLFTQSGCTRTQLQAIVVTQGPGSFAGVRLGLSVAQSLAFALDLPVMTVSSLAACAFSALHLHAIDSVTAILDARMQEIYLGTYEGRGATFKVRSEDAMAPINAIPTQWAGCAAIGMLEPTYTVGLIAPILLEMQQVLSLSMQSPLDLKPVYLRNDVAQVPLCNR